MINDADFPPGHLIQCHCPKGALEWQHYIHMSSQINDSAYSRMKRNLAIAITIIVLASCAVLWVIGGSLAKPRHQIIGEIPTDLIGQGVQFKSQSGSMLRGWFIPDGRSNIDARCSSKQAQHVESRQVSGQGWLLCSTLRFSGSW
jgi:hypothetical protein